MSAKKQFITEENLLHAGYELGVKIANSDFKPTMIVGLWRGGSVVGIAVQECLQYLGVQTDHIAIRTSYRGMNSYQNMVDNHEQEIRVHGTQYLLESLNENDGLLIVDDVFSSGLTTQAVINRLAKRMKLNMPKDVRVAATWYKPSHNRTEKAPDFYLYTTEDWLVMPYELSGLAHEEIAQHKPFMLPILNNLD